MILDKFSLKGKSGIVTGGGSGLGKGMAAAVVQAGAGTLIVGRRKDVLEKTAKELRQFGGPVVPVPADLSKMEEIPKVVARAMKEFGKIDFLFNNAGTIRRAPCEEYSEADWDIVIQTNLKAPFFLAQAVAKTMIAAKRPGSIINTSSLIAFIGGKNVPAYAASKGGLNQFTKSLANEWAKYGIRVNAIAPGYIETQIAFDYWNTFPDPAAERRRAYDLHPTKRIGRPEEVAMTAVFLASDEAPFINAACIVIDGGRSVLYHD